MTKLFYNYKKCSGLFYHYYRMEEYHLGYQNTIVENALSHWDWVVVEDESGMGVVPTPLLGELKQSFSILWV